MLLAPKQFSGQIHYHAISLTSTRGETADIFQIASNIHIYEDLFANTLSGSIDLLDASGFASSFPIIGQETLDIKFDTVGSEPKLLRFVVYKITRDQLTQNADNVRLYFVSLESYISLSTVISKSFKGSTSDIAKVVFENYIGTARSFNIEPSKFQTQIISPKWNPIYLLNWLAARSIPANGSMPSYFFYENFNGFNFESLESKFNREPVYTWKKQQPFANAGEDRIVYNTATIEHYKLLEGFDFLSAQSNGMMSSEVYIVDAISNSFRKHSFNYIDEFNNSKHLNRNPASSKNTSFGYKHNTTGQTRIIHDHSNMFNGLDDTNKYTDWVLSRSSFIQQMNSQRLMLQVAGQGIVTLGDVVSVQIPLPTNNEIGHNLLDPVLSGKYIITAIHHTMDVTSHRMDVEVSKESINVD